MWSAAILEELEYHETAKLIKRGEGTDEAAQRALRLVTQMRAAFDDAEVHGWEPLEGTYGLPDPDDEHVVAAAVVAGAGAIVTHNLRDFPGDRLPGRHRRGSPGPVRDQYGIAGPGPGAAVAAIVARSGRRGPLLTEHEVLDTLADRYDMSAATELIRQAR